MFRCCSLETSHPLLLPQSLKDCSINLCLFFFSSAYRVIINILPEHLSKDLNTRCKKLSLPSTKVLIILNKQESVEQFWFCQMLSVEMVKELGKKKFFLRTTWLFWDQNPSSWSRSTRSPGRRPWQPCSCPSSCLPWRGILFFLWASESPSCFRMNPTFCLSNLETVVFVCL